MENMVPLLRKIVGGLSAAMVVLGALLMFIGWVIMLFSDKSGLTGRILFEGGNAAFFPGFLILGYWALNTQPPAPQQPQQPQQ